MVGIILVDYVDVPVTILASILVGLLTLLITIHIVIQRSRYLELFSVCIGAFFICTGYLLHKSVLPEYNTYHYTHFTSSNVETLFIEIKERLKPTSYQDKFVGVLKKIDGERASGLILININKDSLSKRTLQVGDHIHIRTAIDKVPTPRNPYQFDYGNYLKRKKIYGQVTVKKYSILNSESKSNGIQVVAGRFRESIQKKLKSHAFTKEQLAIINALVLGQRQGIDTEMNKQYAAAGMMHILAVSGLHVGIILLLLRLVTRPISGYKLRYIRSGLIIILIWLFAILTGLSPSVLRAATMFSFLEASVLLGSKKESGNALIASAFVLLLFDPLLVYQVGFQLSYLAVLAILWIQPWLSALLTIKNRILRFFWNTATVTTAAQLGVMPLSLFYFHQFPGLFLVSNLLVLPLLGVLLGAGVFVVILAALDILPDFLVTSFGAVIDTLNLFIGWVASKEEFVFRHISISIFLMLGIYLLIVSSIALFKKYSFRRLLFTLTSILIVTLILAFEKTNVRQGQFIIFHKSKQTLVGQFNHSELMLQTEDSLWDYHNDSRIRSLQDNNNLRHITSSNLQNIISFKSKKVLIIDSLAVYTIKNFIPHYILLTQSPNINLERLIDHYPKAHIIADGNNYKSDIDRWKKTCRKRKIPFHSTYEKGAYIIE